MFILTIAMAGGSKQDDSPPNSWDGESDVAVESEQKVQRPRMYKVLLHNDDYTTMDFVVMVLVTIFHLQDEQAVQVMLHVHERGSGVAGTYSREVAETKVQKVTDLAHEYEFPLLCSMEPE